MNKIKCETCGEQFKTQVDLEAHLFNNKHCNANPVACPECLTRVTQNELDTFGGLCEDCATILD